MAQEKYKKKYTKPPLIIITNTTRTRKQNVNIYDVRKKL